MKYILVLIIYFLFDSDSIAQNLVLNGSFEQYSGCPNNINQVDSAIFWKNPSTGGLSGATPDYFNACAAQSSGIAVPAIFTGYQTARTGQSFCGLIAKINAIQNYREYIEGQLLVPLIQDECYLFKMYINLGNSCGYSVHDVGVYFSDTLISGMTTTLPFPFTPEIINSSLNVFDTLNWTLVSSVYIATGGEKYFIIGNFKNDANTPTYTINTIAQTQNAYLLIDDVSLISSNCVGFNEQMTMEGVTVFPNPVRETINVTLSNNKQSEFILYEMHGRELAKVSFINSASIDILNLEKGIYFYTILCIDGHHWKGKIRID